MKYSIVYRTIVILLYLSILPSLAFTQDKPVVFGKVTDAKTGEPLILANVYLSNTFMGASTNKSGDYTFSVIEKGVYNMIASYIGYETVVKKVRFDKIGGFKFDFKLTAKTTLSTEVVVEGKKPKNWDRNLRKFKKNFLGDSEVSKKCKILNPYVLGFSGDNKRKYFEAIAEDRLIVENRALGYILRYALLDFTLDHDYLNYWGEPHFEAMTPKNDDELREWEENREKAYFGSRRHFLKTLVDSTTIAEGFQLHIIDALPPDHLINIPITNPDTLFTKKNDNEFELRFDDFLIVIYLPGKLIVPNREVIGNKTFQQTTAIILEEEYPTSYFVIKENLTLFDRRGILLNPFDVLSYGTWSKERVVDLLPWEYKPGGK